jgi:hypothetical protein
LKGYLIDGKYHHARQNRLNLSRKLIAELHPFAQSVREVRRTPKVRFAYVLANTELERAERVRLMRYRAQTWQPLIQPRLLCKRLPKLLTNPL